MAPVTIATTVLESTKGEWAVQQLDDETKRLIGRLSATQEHHDLGIDLPIELLRPPQA